MIKKLFSKKSPALIDKKTPDEQAKDYYQKANTFLMQGQLELAIEDYRHAVSMKPDFADAYCNLGVALKEHGKLDEAIESYRQALAITPNDAEVQSNLAEVFWQQGKLAAAIEAYQHALALNPDAVHIYLHLGVLFKQQHQPNKALASYQQALALQPDNADVLFNIAELFQAQGRLDDAIQHYQQAVTCNPHFAAAYNNLGMALQAQGNLAAALPCFQQALSINPDYIDIYNNLGLLFHAQGELDKAVASFQRVLAMQPDHAAAYYNLGNLLFLQRKLDQAITCYQKSLAFYPERVETEDMLFYTQLHCCDWSAYISNKRKIAQRILAGEYGYNPFNFLAFSNSAAEQFQCAKSFAQKYPLTHSPLWTGQRYQHDKIRLAYLSADFHNHATAYLLAELIEKHDKSRFEITAISFEPANDSEMRGRLFNAFDRFIDVQNKADRDIAELLQTLEIDIAVDLKGYTQDSRPGIFAHRAAPIQISYLGYPGTMGAEYIDYILADSYLIPAEHQAYYTEKVVYLPDSYQVNDSKRTIATYTPSRKEVNLPETGFVFCCFNDNYKITPDIFAIWMRLLSQIENSVLWLLEGNAFAAVNLKKEAMRRGISPERLIFAPRMKLDQHLARHKLADLFLDTLPINAHTTSSDALWAGLPVLTCLGKAFAGRVAGSLLNAIGLPELITHNLEEYETLALKLATTPAMLIDIHSKLAENRTTYPLFDTERFCSSIEAAYLTMWERYQRGELPENFSVKAFSKPG